jgi:ankyrin repeat protein
LAAYGDNELIQKFLSANAVSFLSDFKNGYFPVDVAGVNGHGETVKILIENYIKHVKMLLSNKPDFIKRTQTSDAV